METETNNHKNYVKPAMQEIEMVTESQLMVLSNYDGALTD